MSRYSIRTIIKEIPESSNPLKDIAVNTGKLLGVMLVMILLTNLLVKTTVGTESLLMISFLSVLIVSIITPKYAYGIASALIASLVYDYIVMEPFYGFSINVRFPITLLTMLLGTILTSTLFVLLKHQANLAYRREQRSELMFNLGQELADCRDVPSVVRIVTECLTKQLECDAILFTGDPRNMAVEDCAPFQSGCADSFLTPEEIVRIHRIFISGDADALDSEEETVSYHPVKWGEAVLGVAGIHYADHPKPLSPWNNELIQLICRQTAHSLMLQQAREEQNDLRIGAEKEKMRNNLLRSISHDLRTPLTSILGASNAMLEQKDMPEETRDNLLRDTLENTKWLIRMVENILTVTKISQESLQLHKTKEAAEEVIAQSVAIVRGRFPDCMIHVKIPDELILVPMDATLISQVIINLLENAIKNSEEGSLVLLNLRLKDRFALFEITDHGRGIPSHLLDSLFEIHSMDEIAADATRGIGIGLSICHTIIQAHGGTIEGHNRKEGGARFRFMLPLEDADETPVPASGSPSSSGAALS
ncbi:MAG: ATP-binding protein [Clostridiales bacterium]|nr:ATP-binding protein [Clostridiales bacterium]